MLVIQTLKMYAPRINRPPGGPRKYECGVAFVRIAACVYCPWRVVSQMIIGEGVALNNI